MVVRFSFWLASRTSRQIPLFDFGFRLRLYRAEFGRDLSRWSCRPSSHLRIQGAALRRPCHHHDFHARVIEALGEDADIDDELDFPFAEILEDLCAVALVRLAAKPSRPILRRSTITLHS